MIISFHSILDPPSPIPFSLSQVGRLVHLFEREIDTLDGELGGARRVFVRNSLRPSALNLKS